MPPLNNPYDPGQFYLAQITVPNPAAGAEAVLTIPPGYVYEILSLAFTLTNSGIPRDRYVSLELQDLSGNTLFTSTLQDAIIANMVVHFALGAGFSPRNPSAAFWPAQLSWPVDLLMLGHNTLNILVANIDFDDQISDIRILVKQWFST